MGGIVGGLVLAWILTWFRVDNIIINGVNELFGLEITRSGYYVMFALIGLIVNLLRGKRVY
ncbi:MAG: hypothetical protein WAP98_06760 [Caldicoprobacterales bacterium]|jgi:hypothetical protein|nr:hypothetical protein [Clostridia bacterium]MDI9513370.1 hypothetical protein [Bacillota bacterium]NLH57797.1 hypothetical protein [Clostridiales bacterium]